MGLFGDIKAVAAVQKIKKGGVANLSISQITNLLVNMTDARNKLSPIEFHAVYELYRKYRECNTMLLYDMNEYAKTAVKIVRSFDKIAPYEKYCGGNEFEYAIFMDELREEKITKENIHEALERLVKNSSDYADGGYIKYMVETAQKASVKISHEDAREFAGILVLAEENGVDDALEKFDYLLMDWIEKSNNFEQYFRYLNEFPYFCGALYANEFLTKEKSDELASYYSEKVQEKILRHEAN